jgi:hypothetical protein
MLRGESTSEICATGQGAPSSVATNGQFSSVTYRNSVIHQDRPSKIAGIDGNEDMCPPQNITLMQCLRA